MSFLAKADHYLFRYAGYPYMRVTRDDASFERIRYLLQFLRTQNQPLRLLDAGCSGGVAFFMIEHEAPGLLAEYVGADFNAARLYGRYAHFKTPHQFFDTNLDDDWNHGQFDVVWCSECLEHIMDDGGVFKKLRRSVKPGGYIVVSMPSESFRKKLGKELPELLEVSPIQNGGHVRLGYTPESLRQMAQGTGAELVCIDAATRTDKTYMYRRNRWPSFLQPLRNLYYTLTRKQKDFYTLSATPDDLENYQSITAVFRVA
jgi:2-polyprenyl-3-methyl-5-hydroxy-6-metoxy-1,4-benzoquinol methylase